MAVDVGRYTHAYMGMHEPQESPADVRVCVYGYGVATISRLFKMIGLVCKRAL